MATQILPPPVIPELLTLAETAEKLRKSPRQLHWMISQGKGPRSRLIGGRRMFLASDVAQYVNDLFNSEE